MNLLLFEARELVKGRVTLGGRRAKHILAVLRLGIGDTLRVGMINGRTGRGTVTGIGENRVELEVRLAREPGPGSGIELILALPRPIMLQRILKQATVLGVERFHLIRSARVEKSYFHSPVLNPEKIRILLQEGLEQAMDTRLPEVSIHHRFKPFVEDVVPALKGQGIIAHPGMKKTLSEVYGRLGDSGREKLLVAVGPEGGWNDFEMGCFLERGFYPFSMGPRILHVDTAVTALLAQVSLLREMQGRGLQKQ
jgi:RsmE family RNA methyltransferase